MVRTYPFNPSTQSFAMEQMAPFNSNNRTKIISDSDSLHHQIKSEHDELLYDNRAAKAQLDFSNMPRQQQQMFVPPGPLENSFRPFDQSLRDNRNSGDDEIPYLLSFPEVPEKQSKGVWQSPPESIIDKVLNIEEEQTTVLGIRSILINGQRFYQPINVASSSNSITSGHSLDGTNNPIFENSGKKQSDSIGISMPVLATAVSFLDNRIGSLQQSQEYEDKTIMLPITKTQLNMPTSAEKTKLKFSAKRRNGPLSPPLVAQTMMTNDEFAKSISSFGSANTTKRPMEPINEDESTPPWARGNPQPKSGKRGTNSWLSCQLPMITERKNHDFGGSFNLNKLDASLNSTNLTYTLPFPSTSMGYKDSEKWAEQTEKERLKLDLLRQIEEKKRRDFLEKQKEFELDERERIRNEIYQQRAKLELEEERRREREKAILLEKKAAHLEEVKKATIKAMEETNRSKTKAEVVSKTKSEIASSNKRKQGIQKDQQKDDEEEEQLEWWERKDRKKAAEQAQLRFRSDSPMIPALRNYEVADQEEEYGSSSRDRRFAPSSRSKSLNFRNQSSRDSRSSGSSTKEN